MKSSARALLITCAALLAAAAPTWVFSQPSAKADKLRALRFEDIRAQLNPAFEITGFSFMPGVGFIDYNRDSYVDIYVVNGKGQPNALYRNNRDGSFTDVAAQAGVADTGQGTGIGVGDLNNDGYPDLYLANGSTVGDGIDSNDGPDRLYINNGDGTFREIAEQAGIDEPGFNSSIGFADYDMDGDLDIAVGRWTDFDFNDPSMGRVLPGTQSHLYRNNGDLTFTNVTFSAGVAEPRYNTWAIGWFDYDNDHDVDLFLTHEQGPVSIFKNKGDGTFTNVTQQSGDVVDFGAWMGIAVGDYNDDGFLDFFSTNISDLRVTRSSALPPLVVPPPETWDNPWPELFRNNGDGTFTAVGAAAGVSVPREFSWGCAFADFDNDGRLDLFQAENFSPVGVIGTDDEGAGPSRLHRNLGDGTFDDITFDVGLANLAGNGKYLDARGMAVSDFDKDGNLDLFLVNTPQFVEAFPFGKTPIAGTGVARFFRNLGTGRNWVQLRLIGTGRSNRDAIGAKVYLSSDRGTQLRVLAGGLSTYSTSENILHFGLDDDRTARAEVIWPDGERQVFHLPANQRWTLVQGSSARIPEPAYENSLREGR